jgi:hypothetical protein
VKPSCRFEGCGKPSAGLGLCWGHYMQQRRGIPLRPLYGPHGEGRRTAAPSICSFPDCGRPNNGGGLCAAHRWQQKEGRKLVPVGAAKRWWFLTEAGEAALNTKGGDCLTSAQT